MAETVNRASEYVYKGLSIKVGDPIDVLARTLWGEARGESDDGIRAVADVIMNRVEMDIGNDGKPDWWGEGVVGVCKKPWQFSCWNANDPNRPKMESLTHEGSASFRRCLDAAINAVTLGEDRVDTVEGATHYHTKAVYPAWAKGKNPCKVIGNHLFYNDVG